MRLFILSIAIFISFSHIFCSKEPELPEPVRLIPVNETLDIPWKAVTVREIARLSPPDNIAWPHGYDYRGQTAWEWGDGDPVLFSATQSTQYMWDLGSGGIQTTPVDYPYDMQAWPPIPVPKPEGTAHQNDINFSYIGTRGESTTLSVSVDEGEAVGLPTASYIYTPPNYFNLENLELSLSTVQSPLDRNGAPSLVFRDYADYWFTTPDRVNHLAENWMHIDLFNGDITSLEQAVNHTFGAKFTGFLNVPNIYFFAGNSPVDQRPLLYVSNLNETIALDINPPETPDSTEPVNKTWRITGYIPSVRWNGSYIVFAEKETGTPEQTAITALKMDLDGFPDINPSIIWQMDVPNIFSISTTVISGADSRPYTVCLDPTTGDLRVFDPLIGQIRYEGQIELAEWAAGLDLAFFCVNFEPDPSRPIFIIFDPNANRIIEFELQISLPPN